MGSCGAPGCQARFFVGQCLGVDGDYVSGLLQRNTRLHPRPVPRLFTALVRHSQSVARRVICHPSAHEKPHIPQLLSAGAGRYVLRVQILFYFVGWVSSPGVTRRMQWGRCCWNLVILGCASLTRSTFLFLYCKYCGINYTQSCIVILRTPAITLDETHEHST